MKKHLVKVLSLLLVCVCILSICAPAAQAASAKSFTSKSYTGSSRGGTSHYFYVKTNNTTSTKSVKLTFNKGKLTTSDSTDKLMKNSIKTAELRAAYEIKIDYWNGKTWVREDNYDAYNWSSDTIPLKEANKVYRIQVYQWRVSTTLTSYHNKYVWRYDTFSTYVEDPYWSTVPTFKVGSATRVKMYTSNPL